MRLSVQEKSPFFIIESAMENKNIICTLLGVLFICFFSCNSRQGNSSNSQNENVEYEYEITNESDIGCWIWLDSCAHKKTSYEIIHDHIMNRGNGNSGASLYDVAKDPNSKVTYVFQNNNFIKYLQPHETFKFVLKSERYFSSEEFIKWIEYQICFFSEDSIDFYVPGFTSMWSIQNISYPMSSYYIGKKGL